MNDYAAFKRVRNKIRQYFPEDIIFACIQKLNDPKLKNVSEFTKFPPWYLYLILKWTFIFGEYLSPDRRPFSPKKIFELINLMHELHGSVRLPSSYSNIFLFFRNVAFQQFWYQEDFTRARFARQCKLFKGLNEKDNLSLLFKNKTNLNINDYLELSSILLSKFIVEDVYHVHFKWFEPLFKSYSKETVERFFKFLSNDIPSLRNKLREKYKLKRSVSYEFHEQSPLINFPILHHNDVYYLFSKELLFNNLQFSIYNILRENYPDEFMRRFGDIFERYIENAISYSGIDFFKESDFKSIVPNGQKIVDFILIEESSNILVEAKGVGLPYLGMVSHLSDVVKDKTKSSIIQGIRQAFDTVNLIANTKEFKGKTFGAENFLIIVTLKDFFLNNGNDFYEYIDKSKINDLISKHGNLSLRLQNIYFLSVDDFEILVEFVNKKKITFSEAIRLARDNDSDVSSRKFIFRQHLEEKFKSRVLPEYLQNEIDNLIELLETKIK